jgi:anion-transporting  ArsA/GET3 family ATPase
VTGTLRSMVDDASVVVCCGSGGVGKTTAAASIGIEAARRGRRVVVVTIDPARRLADALGLSDGLGPDPQRIDVQDGENDGSAGQLWAMMLDTAVTFDAVVRRYATDEAQAERILANSFFRNMATSLSGTQEYMAAETLYLLHHDDRFDLVVVDTPPTRNALDFLQAPGVLARFLDHKLFKLLMLPARGGMRVVNLATQPLLRAIGRVVGSDVLADVVAFFQSFAGMEGGFRERADDVIGLLRSDTTRFVVIASPRLETISEAVWFADQLGQQGITQLAGIVNRVHPAFGEGTSNDARAKAEAAGTGGDAAAEALWRNLAELRAVREAEFVELATFTERFQDRPWVAVPQLAGDVHDRVGLAHVGEHLFRDPD